MPFAVYVLVSRSLFLQFCEESSRFFFWDLISQCTEYEDICRLWCCMVYSGRNPTVSEVHRPGRLRQQTPLKRR
jgi:hypothetical protein